MGFIWYPAYHLAHFSGARKEHFLLNDQIVERGRQLCEFSLFPCFAEETKVERRNLSKVSCKVAESNESPSPPGCKASLSVAFTLRLLSRPTVPPLQGPPLSMALSSQGCFQPLSCAPTPSSLCHPLPEPQSLTAPLPASLVNELLISALGKHRRSLLLSTLAFVKL